MSIGDVVVRKWSRKRSPSRKAGDVVDAPRTEGVSAHSGVAGRPLFKQPSIRVIGDTVMFIDFVLIAVLSLVAQFAYITFYLGSVQDEMRYLTVGAMGAFFIVGAFRTQGVYSLDSLETLRGQNTRLAFGFFFSLLVLLGAAYLLKVSDALSRGWLVIWVSMSFATVYFVHSVAARIIRHWKSFGVFARRVAISGGGNIAAKLIEHLGANVEQHSVVGVYDDLDVGEMPSVVIAGGLSDLIRIGQAAHVEEILIALPMSNQKRVVNAVEQLSILPATIRLCPDLVAFHLRPVGIVDYSGVSILEIVRMPMDDWAPIVKSIEDRVLAGLALFLVMPIMLLTAVAIKLDSPGPVFFRQRRHGFNHQVFSVLKFRSMNVAQDGSNVPQAQQDDPRVTRVGWILRRTSIDELPQLFNVLSGEMSLVGPRPHAVAHNEHYSSLLATYARRHKVKPVTCH